MPNVKHDTRQYPRRNEGLLSINLTIDGYVIVQFLQFMPPTMGGQQLNPLTMRYHAPVSIVQDAYNVFYVEIDPQPVG